MAICGMDWVEFGRAESRLIVDCTRWTVSHSPRLATIVRRKIHRSLGSSVEHDRGRANGQHSAARVCGAFGGGRLPWDPVGTPQTLCER
jgi:hypothetical protein